MLFLWTRVTTFLFSISLGGHSKADLSISNAIILTQLFSRVPPHCFVMGAMLSRRHNVTTALLIRRFAFKFLVTVGKTNLKVLPHGLTIEFFKIGQPLYHHSYPVLSLFPLLCFVTTALLSRRRYRHDRVVIMMAGPRRGCHRTREVTRTSAQTFRMQYHHSHPAFFSHPPPVVVATAFVGTTGIDVAMALLSRRFFSQFFCCS